VSRLKTLLVYLLFVVSVTLVNFYARGRDDHSTSEVQAAETELPEKASVDAEPRPAPASVAQPLGRLLKNGVRLLIAAVVLALGAAVSGAWSMPRVDMWRYALLGLLTNALPQGLLFVSFAYGVNEVDASLMEAAIPGLVLASLYLSGQRALLRNVLLSFVVLGLLIAHVVNRGGSGSALGLVLVACSCVATAAGFLMLGNVLPSPKVDNESSGRRPAATRTLLNAALVKTTLVIAWAGVLTLVAVGAWKVVDPTEPLTNFTGDWWMDVLMLAVVGSVIGWLAFFWLEVSKQLVLATSGLLVAPLVTLLVWRVYHPQEALDQTGIWIVIALVATLLLYHGTLVRQFRAP
jgi:hypothetical protein